jgi:hypothetical protein
MRMRRNMKGLFCQIWRRESRYGAEIRRRKNGRFV